MADATEAAEPLFSAKNRKTFKRENNNSINKKYKR